MSVREWMAREAPLGRHSETLAHATVGFAGESVAVTERKYAVVSLDELDTFPAMSGAPVLLPLRQRLDVRAFGINCWTAPVGAPVIERHSEPDGDEEVYIVVRGRVRFTIGEETFEPGPATVVYVPPDTTREAVAVEPETLVVAIGAKPGEAFEPKSWEDFQIAFAQGTRAGRRGGARVPRRGARPRPKRLAARLQRCLLRGAHRKRRRRLRAPRAGVRARSGARAKARCERRGFRGAAI
jgi:quercetin dioxygenase-like cupin family protein